MYCWGQWTIFIVNETIKLEDFEDPGNIYNGYISEMNHNEGTDLETIYFQLYSTKIN